MNMTTLQDFDYVAILPIIVLLATSFIPLLIKVFRGNREPNPFATLVYSLAGLVFAFGWTASMAGARNTAFFDALVVDGVGVFTSCLAYVLAAAALLMAYDHVATRGRQFAEFCFLTVSSTIGIVILIMANDLLITFIGLETMSLCLYILVAMSREQVLSKEAAFKYFVLGSFASAIFLYGVALLYGTAGTTYLPALAEKTGELITTNRMFLVGVGMLVLGFLFKVSVFPLHAWTPDVYQGASTPVTAFMSTAVKAASFVAFFRFMSSEGFTQSVPLFNVLTWLAVLTMTIGNVAAVMQDNLKRMLAYSSVAHSGYLMIAIIATAFGTNLNAAASSLLFYLFSYGLMTLGSFAVLALFEKHENTNMKVSDLRGLAKSYPGLSLAFTVLMLSLAGIPPTLGFFGKLFLFSVAIEQGFYWLALWGVVNSVISVYYYLRPIVMMYFSEEEPAELMKTHWFTRAAVLVSAILIVVIGLYSTPIIDIVRSSVVSLF